MEGIGVILEGSALLTRENVMGQRVIMANLEQSDILVKHYYLVNNHYGLLRLKLQRLVKLCSFLLKHLLIHCLIANNAKQKSCPTYWRTCLKSYSPYKKGSLSYLEGMRRKDFRV